MEESDGHIHRLRALINRSNQKLEHSNPMSMKFIGKVLFPHLPPWQSQRQAKHLVAAFVVAIILGCAVVAIMFLQNGRR